MSDLATSRSDGDRRRGSGSTSALSDFRLRSCISSYGSAGRLYAMKWVVACMNQDVGIVGDEFE